MIHEMNRGMGHPWGVTLLIRVISVVAVGSWTGLAAFEATVDVRQDPRWLNQLPPIQWPLPKPSPVGLTDLTRAAMPVVPPSPPSPPPVTVEPSVVSAPAVEPPAVVVVNKVEAINPATEIGDHKQEESKQDRAELGWELQVWSGHSLSLAKKYRTWFTRRHADLLNGLVVRVEKISAKNRYGKYYKVRVSLLDQRTSAALCDALKSRAEQCIVVRVL
ncbi:hypothetical protein CCP4SC76_2020012 [Gammaproteobacteria bacterium]